MIENEKKKKSIFEESFFLILGIGFTGFGIYLLIMTYTQPGIITLIFAILSITIFFIEKSLKK